MTTKFRDWINAYGQNKLADKLGVHYSTVSCWANGYRQPMLDTAVKIIKLSKGKLKAADLKKPSQD